MGEFDHIYNEEYAILRNFLLFFFTMATIYIIFLGIHLSGHFIPIYEFLQECFYRLWDILSTLGHRVTGQPPPPAPPSSPSSTPRISGAEIANSDSDVEIYERVVLNPKAGDKVTYRATAP